VNLAHSFKNTFKGNFGGKNSSNNKCIDNMHFFYALKNVPGACIGFPRWCLIFATG
jgi:hypothetical protein